jgi:AbrB family looped-hinge helix DNA binding protein
MLTATLTTKGQITIPLEVRERLGLKAGDQIEFQLGPSGEVVITSKRIPFEEIQGILRSPGQKAVSVREMDKGIERAVHARWKRAARQAK